MERKFILLLLILLTSSFVFSQNNESLLQIEQKALTYFLDNIHDTPIYYDGFENFNIDSAKIYVYPKTYTETELTIRNRNYSDKREFFPLDSSSESGLSIVSDTIQYMLDLTGLRAIDASTVEIKDVREPLDLVIGLTSRYYFKEHYFVKIYINVPIEWKSNEAIVKLDTRGNPMDIRFEYGDN